MTLAVMQEIKQEAGISFFDVQNLTVKVQSENVLPRNTLPNGKSSF